MQNAEQGQDGEHGGGEPQRGPCSDPPEHLVTPGLVVVDADPGRDPQRQGGHLLRAVPVQEADGILWVAAGEPDDAGRVFDLAALDDDVCGVDFDDLPDRFGAGPVVQVAGVAVAPQQPPQSAAVVGGGVPVRCADRAVGRPLEASERPAVAVAGAQDQGMASRRPEPAVDKITSPR